MDNKRFLLAEVKSAEGDDYQGSGEFEAILSMPTLDRDNEIVDERAFEPLPDHITVDIDHGMSVSTTVGSGVPFYDGDVLKMKGSFSSIPLAQDVRTLVREGHIRKMSVAFRDAMREDDEKGVPHVRKGELLNAALIPIPSNRDASVLMSKSYVDAVSKVGARNSANDAARMQAIHDLSTENGAKCAPILEVLGVEDVRVEATITGESKNISREEVGRIVERKQAELVAELTAAMKQDTQLQLDVKTKGEENSTEPVMAPAEQARLAIARAEADLLLT